MDPNSNDEEDEITAECVLKTIERAWINEKLAPEILPHQSDMIECMLQQIQIMEKNINKLPKIDIKADVHNMELSRIKYMISSYLRTRLQKIEKFVIPILNEERERAENATNYLTPAELNYAQDYLSNIKNHLQTVALKHMTNNMQTYEESKLAVYPDMNSHIFIKANETINGLVLENPSGDQDEEIDMEEGSQHLLRYKPIAEFIKNGKVQLI